MQKAATKDTNSSKIILLTYHIELLHKYHSDAQGGLKIPTQANNSILTYHIEVSVHLLCMEGIS
jgi:hypothetical protein